MQHHKTIHQHHNEKYLSCKQFIEVATMSAKPFLPFSFSTFSWVPELASSFPFSIHHLAIPSWCNRLLCCSATILSITTQWSSFSCGLVLWVHRYIFFPHWFIGWRSKILFLKNYPLLQSMGKFHPLEINIERIFEPVAH